MRYSIEQYQLVMELITILGQTVSGKTSLSLELAHYISSLSKRVWILSCDSRQVYKHLNLGSAKVEGEWDVKHGLKAYYVQHIPHFLIDFVDPSYRYSLSDYIEDWKNLFSQYEHNYPDYVLLVGGTGLWARAINQEYQLDALDRKSILDMPDFHLMSLTQLQDYYQTFNLNILNNSEWNNPRRLINFLQREYAKQKVVKENNPLVKPYPQFNKKYLFALEKDQEQLKKDIETRLNERIEKGLIDEVTSLFWLGERLVELGLEYRSTYYYLIGMMNEQEYQQNLLKDNIKYAKRQMTWLKKENPTWVKNVQDIIKQVF